MLGVVVHTLHAILAGAWLGGAVGLVHALYVLIVAMPALLAMHPRMAGEQDGPTPTKQLENRRASWP